MCVGYSPLPLLSAGFRGCPAYCRVFARPHILAPRVLVPFRYLRPLTVRSWLLVHVQSHLHLHCRQHIRECCRPRRCPSRDPMLFLEEILVTIHVVLVSPLSLAYCRQVLAVASSVDKQRMLSRHRLKLSHSPSTFSPPPLSPMDLYWVS